MRDGDVLPVIVRQPDPLSRCAAAQTTLISLFFLAATACDSLGPGTVPRDRFGYDQSISESWKRQILLNIVRLRYLDPPTFVDVGQIVSGYTLETGVIANGQGSSADFSGNFLNVGGHATYTDRPTITYTPLTGSRFVRGLMTPIPPESIFYTIDSGWPADVILKTALSSINGLKNGEYSVGSYHPPDPKFLRVVELIRKIQNTGGVGMKVVVDKEKHQTNIVTLRPSSNENQNDMTECRQLLGLDPQAVEFQLVFGSVASNDHELAVQTRSILHIMQAMAAKAEVPAEDIRDGRVTPGSEQSASASTQPSAANPPIRCSPKRPKDAFVAVQYRSHWFWVDDRDLLAKRDLGFMMLLFTLTDTGEREPPPLVTIQAQ
jgi:hypothetical protein